MFKRCNCDGCVCGDPCPSGDTWPAWEVVLWFADQAESYGFSSQAEAYAFTNRHKNCQVEIHSLDQRRCLDTNTRLDLP